MAADILTRIQTQLHTFSKGQKRIAGYILESYDKAAFMTASKLGKTVSVSESTVVRFAVELGFDGYPSMQRSLQEIVRTRLTSVQRIEAAKVTPTPEPTSTPELITPIPEDQRTSPAPEEDPDAMLTTTTDPITGAIMPADPNTLAEGTPEPTATPAPLAGRTIVIDAGKSKGGTHRGVSSKTYEYKINLAFAQALQEELTGLGASVVMTRESNDEVVGAKSRIKTINNSGADLAISLFCNDLDNNKTRGAEAFVGKGTGNAEASRRLAGAVLAGYTRATDMPTRDSDDTVRTVTNKEVLSGAKIPTMGLVLGQLSNRSDDENLNDAAFIAKAARGIANGIRSYLGA